MNHWEAQRLRELDPDSPRRDSDRPKGLDSACLENWMADGESSYSSKGDFQSVVTRGEISAVCRVESVTKEETHNSGIGSVDRPREVRSLGLQRQIGQGPCRYFRARSHSGQRASTTIVERQRARRSPVADSQARDVAAMGNIVSPVPAKPVPVNDSELRGRGRNH